MKKFWKKNVTRFPSAAASLLLIFSAWPISAQPVFGAAPAQPSSYIIKLNDDDASALNSVGGNLIANLTPRFTFSTNPNLSNIFSFDSELPLEALRAHLAGRYVYLEPELQITTDVAVVADDPGFTLDSTSVDRQWGLAKAKFPDAWTKTTGAKNIIVGIIDTGVDKTHSDLSRTPFSPGYDFLKNTDIPTNVNSDDNGHGTLVAGVIGATANNKTGIAGGAWQVRIMPLKALDTTGSGNSSDISEAIVWAADHGANIINMSLGGIGFAHDTTLANSISYAYNKDVVIVAAAGNDVATTGGNLDQEPVFPVCDDNGDNMIIGVAATDFNDRKAEFSNFGKSCIDVAAPGRRILSTINFDPVTHARTPNAYAYASGTSMAAPLVTAEAVLIRAQSPTATNRQIRDRIIATADNIDVNNLTRCNGGSCQGLLGAGRINVARALAEVILPPKVLEGDLVRLNNGASNGRLYYISGGKRHVVIPFVQRERFAGTAIKKVNEQDIAQFPEGAPAEPQDGTLIKSTTEATVYYMSKSFKQPVTAQVFAARQFSFSNVVVLAPDEVAGWLLGSFLPPPEGTLVKTQRNPTVYWVVGDTLHPINFGFYTARGLNIFPIVVVSDNDMKSFAKGEPYIR